MSIDPFSAPAAANADSSESLSDATARADGGVDRLAPTVSVIVPVRNDPVGIQRCVAALRRQTYPEDRVEILVVDNDSTDGTFDVLTRLGVRALRDRSTRNSYAARNRVRLAGTTRVDFRLPLDEPAYERVFGADLTYERRNAEPLARWLASALVAGGTAWLSDPNRSAGDSFPEHAEAAGLRVEVQAVETTAPAGLLHRGRIWRVYR